MRTHRTINHGAAPEVRDCYEGAWSDLGDTLPTGRRADVARRDKSRNAELIARGRQCRLPAC